MKKASIILITFMFLGIVAKAQLDIEKCSCSKVWKPEFKCENAIDGNIYTGWNSGAMPPQWIKLTLSIAHDIKKITWVNGMYPNGEVTMDFKFYNNNGELITSIKKTFDCENGETNTAYVNVSDVKIVKIFISKSPSWGALLDVSLF